MVKWNIEFCWEGRIHSVPGFSLSLQVPRVLVYKLVWHVFMLSIMYNGLKVETNDA